MMKRMVLFFSFLVIGCSGTHFHQVSENSTGYLPAVSHAPVRVTVNHSIDTHDYKSMAYVNIQMHGIASWPEYQDYVMQSVKHLGFFDRVVTREPTVFINAPAFEPTQQADGENWTDVDNPMPINSLLKQYGPHFLILEADLSNVSSNLEDLTSYVFDLKVIEPSTRRVLMVATNQAVMREGVDKGVINPVMNFTLGYLNANDSTYPKVKPGPQNLEEWWEQLCDGFVEVMFI